MKQDMDLIRKILLKIEEDYVDVALYNLQIEGYDLKTVAYHCKILHEGKFISDYKGRFGDNQLLSFGVGSLTWEGHEFLDKIRNDSIWDTTKTTIINNGLPMILDVVKNVSTSIISSMTEGAVKAMLNG
jgi:hypothetical protein